MENAGALIWDQPVLLISRDGGKFSLNESVLKAISSVRCLKVIGIVGAYRTGKSFLMNELMDHKAECPGFELGHTTTGKTRGIWIWGRYPETEGDPAMICIDTEGLFDVDHEDTSINPRLGIASLLLTSLLVVNVVGKMDQQTIQFVDFFSELTSSLVASDADEGDQSELDLGKCNPQLMWLIRDFQLEFEDGETAQSYVEAALSEKKARNNMERLRELSKKSVRSLFPKLFGRVLPPPVADNYKLADLDSPKKKEAMRPEFSRQIKALAKELISLAEPKLLQSSAEFGTLATGSSYRTYVKKVVEFINDGKIIKIPDLFESVVVASTTEALNQASSKYDDCMNDVVKLPCTDSKIMQFHLKAVGEAMTVLRSHCMAEVLTDAVTLLEVILGDETELDVTNEEEDDDGEISKLRKRFNQPSVSQSRLQKITAKNISCSRDECRKYVPSLISSLRDAAEDTSKMKSPQDLEKFFKDVILTQFEKDVGKRVALQVSGEFRDQLVNEHLPEAVKLLATTLKLSEAEKEAAAERQKLAAEREKFDQERKRMEENEKSMNMRLEALKDQSSRLEQELQASKRNAEQSASQLARLSSTIDAMNQSMQCLQLGGGGGYGFGGGEMSGFGGGEMSGFGGGRGYSGASSSGGRRPGWVGEWQNCPRATGKEFRMRCSASGNVYRQYRPK